MGQKLGRPDGDGAPVGRMPTTGAITHQQKIEASLVSPVSAKKPVFKFDETKLYTLSSASIIISFPIQPCRDETKFKWYKDDSSLDASARHVTMVVKEEVQLHIRHLKPSDGGKYRVQATNLHGSAEASCILNVQDIKQGWTLVANHRVQLCENVDARQMIPYLKQHKILNAQELLSVQAMSSRFEQVDKLIDVLVAQKPEICLPFFNILRDIGHHDIVDLILSQDAQDESAKIHLQYKTLSPLLNLSQGAVSMDQDGATTPTGGLVGQSVFLTPLSDTLAVSTDTVVISCQVPLHLQDASFIWTKNQVPLADSRYKTQNGPGFAKLTIEDAEISDTGRYFVTVTNDKSETSSSCDLIVQDIGNCPTFIRDCRATISSMMNVDEMLPHLKDILTPDLEDAIHQLESPVRRGDELINFILDRPLEDCKLFLMALKKTEGTHLVDIILGQGCRPRFVTELKSQKVTSGMDVSLTCQLHMESHSPSVVWMKDGNIVRGGRYRAKTRASIAELLIQHITISDTGSYEAKASNKFGSASSSCYVEVQGSRPKFLTELQDVKCLRGKSIELACQIPMDTPHVAFKWYKNGEEILKEMPGYELLEAQGTSTLRISKAESDHAAKYEVVAVNRFGKANSACMVSVLDELDETVSKTGWSGSKYLIITEEKYNEYKEDGLSDEAILKKDKKKKKRIDGLLSNYSLPENRPQPDEEKPESLNVVFIGRTGVGKSTTANTFLGVETFHGSSKAKSETQTVAYDEVKLDNRLIRVIDTPGLADTDASPETTALELAKVIDLCPNGVHAFLYLQDATTRRFTKEQRDVKDQIQAIFGPELLQHTAMVLTHAEGVFKNRSLREYLDSDLQGSPLEYFIKTELQSHIVAIDNQVDTPYERQCMRRALLNITDKVIEFVENEIYTHEIFQLAEELKKNHDDARSLNLDQLVKTEKAAFQDKLRLMREKLSNMVMEYLEKKSVSEVENEVKGGFLVAKQKLSEELMTTLKGDDTSIRISQLSIEDSCLSDDVVDEALHAGYKSFLFKQAKKEQRQREAKKYELILQMSGSAKKVRKKIDKLEAKEGRKLDTRNEEFRLTESGEYSRIKDAITQKVEKKHSNLLDEDRQCITSEEMQTEIETLTKIAMREKAYEDLISQYLAEADQIIWTEIQNYVRRLTYNEWTNIGPVDYDNIYKVVKSELAVPIQQFLTADRIKHEIRIQTNNKKASLDKLVTRITNMIRSFLKDLFTQCAIM